MEIKENIKLAPYTTFGVGGPARYFAIAGSEDELQTLVREARNLNQPVTVLGGGSNVLVGDEGVSGFVIKNEIKGISLIETEEKDHVLVSAGAGEVWDEFVARTVSEGWWGLENLSAIPGLVGATPIQNVGAYGVEVADLISSVKVFDIDNDSFKEFKKEECGFGYRDSFFKTLEGKKLIVVGVTYRLSLTPHPKLHYKDLAERFAGKEEVSQSEIRDAVVEIRVGKFPDWKIIGTAGSFFKNPIVSNEEYEELLKEYPELPGYAEIDGRIKVSLGWILDKVCNLKGYREGSVGLFEKQALVMVNYDDATAKEIKSFANKVSNLVFEKTKIKIEREVNYI